MNERRTITGHCIAQDIAPPKHDLTDERLREITEYFTADDGMYRSPTCTSALHTGRSTGGGAPRGVAIYLFYADVRSILMVLWHFKGTSKLVKKQCIEKST